MGLWKHRRAQGGAASLLCVCGLCVRVQKRRLQYGTKILCLWVPRLWCDALK